MGHYFKQERDTLQAIRNIDNPHLIKPIAAYQFHNEENGSFLFPWAEGGNMREFWKQETARPHKEPMMMDWVLKQMCGLCHALSILHAQTYRHGDLKPENILHFDEGDYKGTLRIADVGLAKFHEATTEVRHKMALVTKTQTGTMHYVSPEFFNSDQIPRVFDVWSLGCIYIEFLIWILHGNDQLVEFNNSRFDHFWENINGEYVVHSHVNSILARLAEDLKGSETALLDILGVITSKMLVPDAKTRARSEEVHDLLEKIYRRAVDDSGYLIQPSIWTRISTRSVPFRRSMGQNLGVPGTGPSPRQPQAFQQSETQNYQISDGSDGTPAIMVQGADSGAANKGPTFPTSTRIAREVSLHSTKVLLFTIMN